MKLSKLLLPAVSATVLLGALVTSASARNFSVSSQTSKALWRSMRFIGGFETVECEIKLRGSLHTRTATKTVNSLIGYITEGTVLRCARGSATINQPSFPWHRRYRGFSGTLPNILSESETVTGAEFRLREPIFGTICTVRRETSALIFTYSLSSGTVFADEVGGNADCEGFTLIVEGSTIDVDGGAVASITIRLI